MSPDRTPGVVPADMKVVSTNWTTPEVHLRIPLADALRNARVLGRGIFGENFDFDLVLGRVEEGEEPRELTPREKAIRRMTVGYLRDQEVSKIGIARAIGIEERELSSWGWNERDWLNVAQVRAEEIELKEKAGVPQIVPHREMKRDESMKAMDRILELVLDDYPSVGDSDHNGKYGVTKGMVLGRRRFRLLTKVRRTFIMHSMGILDPQVTHIARYLGKDHSTILHHGELMQHTLKDPEKRRVFEAQQERIKKKLQEEGLI